MLFSNACDALSGLKRRGVRGQREVSRKRPAAREQRDATRLITVWRLHVVKFRGTAQDHNQRSCQPVQSIDIPDAYDTIGTGANRA